MMITMISASASKKVFRYLSRMYLSRRLYEELARCFISGGGSAAGQGEDTDYMMPNCFWKAVRHSSTLVFTWMNSSIP